ncbi:hypothetical protein [Bacillus sp. FJAT-44742]|uniref:hypothetical protein n=1 Tax=Bacillus sp. FJAT-44742 TaxID=2014005 RepID=UPI0018E1E19C|nr:hypothetical protein [Bacillus sp. FJAT-44742]
MINLKIIAGLLIITLLFISGMLVGHYHAHEQFKEIAEYERELVVIEQAKKEREQKEEKKSIERQVITDDLTQKQEEVAERGSVNFFSKLGKTLNVTGQ